MGRDLYKPIDKYVVDKCKLDNELMKKHQITSEDAAEKMGLNRYYFSRYISRNKGLSKLLMNALEQNFGITYEMIKPDEQMKKEVKETNPELVEAAGIGLDLDKITDLLKDTKELIKENAEYCQMIKQGFRVQTSPRFSTEDISAGVREGIAMWWSQNKSDVMSKLRGTMYAAFFEALHADDKKGGQK